VDQGPRVYIERIDIHGNTRTRDYVIRREFDLGEGDPYNKTIIDLAERRLNGLGYFKSVKITNEPGSSPDHVIIDVAVVDQPTSQFTISGGYSTTEGFIAQTSVSDANFLGRGQYARIAASLGQYSKGIEFNYTEPYFLGYRMAAGFDLYDKDTTNSPYQLYDDYVTGGTLRLGLPITDNITLSPHYSLYNTAISVPNSASLPYDDCAAPINGITPGTPANKLYPSPAYPNQSANCLTNGEASLALKAAAGDTLTSLVGYSLVYNNLNNPKDPTNGLYATATQDFAGAGGDVEYLRNTFEARYYHPLFVDGVTGVLHLQGGDILGYGSRPLNVTDNFNLGPALVRGFAPGGIGPRDVSDPYNSTANSLGGTKYVGASGEVEFPLPGVPKEMGLKGGIFADAGTLFGYEGQTNFGNLLGLSANSPCTPATWMLGSSLVPPGTAGASPVNQGSCIKVQDSSKIRSSVGASLMWSSPLGPITVNYAFPLTKAQGDVTQRFSFSGGPGF
jgi:outer membrane protein insertion porin family